MRTAIILSSRTGVSRLASLSRFLLLLSAVLLGGCPKNSGPKLSEEESARPKPNFDAGLQVVKTPSKNGAIDYAGAYKFFNKAAELGGGKTAHFNAGWTAERAGLPQDAVRHFKAAYDMDPSYEQAMFSLARAYSEAGDANSAVSLYQTYLEANPDNRQVRNELVTALVKAKMFEEAQAQAQEILRHDPKNAQVFRNLSAMYYDQGQLGMSQLTAEEALKHGEDAGTYNNMGVSFLIQGKEPEAIEKFKKAIEIDSSHFEANMNLGWVALDSGDYTLAGTSFSNALRTQPGSNEAKMGMAISARGNGEYKQAETLYQQIMDADPDNEAAFFNAATLQEVYVKDYKAAMKILQTYIDAHPVAPTHPVYARMERVKAAKAEEDERKRIEEEKRKAEEERRKRNQELLANMATQITQIRQKLEMNQACIDPMVGEEVGMVLEQAQMVVDAEEVDMAADIQTMLEGYTPVVDDAIAACAGNAEGGEEGAEGEEGMEEGAEEGMEEGAEGEAPMEGEEGMEEAPE